MPPKFGALALFLLLAPPASARTWFVEPDGTGDAPTIQAAVDSAGPGDQVLLRPGTFSGSGNVDVDFLGKAIAVRSALGASTCVVDCERIDRAFRFRSGEGPSSVLEDVTIARSAPDRAAIEVTLSSPTIRGVVIREGRNHDVEVTGGALLMTGCLYEGNTGNPSGSPGVVSFYEAAGTLESCVFRDNAGGALVLANGGDTTLRGCVFTDNHTRPLVVGSPKGTSDVTLEDCFFDMEGGYSAILGSPAPGAIVVRGCEFRGTGAGEPALRCGGNASFTIEDCLVEQCGEGIDLWNVSDPLVRVCEFRNNLGPGIRSGGTLEGCEIRDNGGPGIITAGSPTIRDCEIRDNGGPGIQAGGSPTIEGCRIVNAAGGVRLTAGTGATVRNCQVTGNGQRALQVFDAQSVTIESCTVASNHAGFSGAGLHAQGSTIDVVQSIFWGDCAGDGLEMWVTGTTVSLSCVNVDTSRLAVFGSGSFVLEDVLEADPLFCSPLDCAAGPGSGGIYGLDAASPALVQPCGPMGVPGPSCLAVGVSASVRPASWAEIKARYRE